eukprot:TRINITY_DN7159_c0_g1_i10.p1 TRINITY_DN7159_c0_g1~~TRINITY_DN7159_c0_g1_i10.p1  ORF type:complete len:500 (-),score=71.82 TRINITY_DN7159_c0_g1_i10:3519-4946(-)
MAGNQISLKLLVDKEMNRVVFAESGNDFVDVLFSFLTMPMGTIVRLTGKESKMGGITTLYESVKDLDVNLLQTNSCKKMLLYPKSASEEHCNNLKVNIDNTKPTKYYVCSWNCCAHGSHLISNVYDSKCECGQSFKKQIVFDEKSNASASSKDGVFVKGNMRFIIRYDLQVFPASVKAASTMLKELGIYDVSVLEERNVNVGAAEVVRLLNCLILTKTPLTDVFLQNQHTIDRADLDSKLGALHLKDIALDSKDLTQPREGKGNGSDSKKIGVKLSVDKSNNKVVYAEGGEEFADLLFSFLTFPLGFVAKFFGGHSGIKCLDNLYRSVQVLGLEDFIKSEECKDLLVDPNLARYFSSKNQPLQIKELAPWKPTIISCGQCNYIGDTAIKIADYGFESCGHWEHRKQLCTINPKYPNVVRELGGTFIAGPAWFMVTDELNVKQLSLWSVIPLLNELNICMGDLEEHVVSLAKEEVT